MKDKKENFNDKIEKIKNSIEMDKEKERDLENQIKGEFEEYKQEFLEDTRSLYDKTPKIQKLVFALLGLNNFLVGFALYFLIRDNKKYKWHADCLLKTSSAAVILLLIATVFKILSIAMDYFIVE